MTAALVSRKQTILVVDDEAIVRSLTRRMLEEHGYGVIEAGNGVEAWTLLESMAGRIDLVVSDVVMPRLDGIELARCMEIMPHPPPILFMSGYGLSPLEVEGPLLVKPFRGHELLAAVHRLLAAPGVGDPESSDALWVNQAGERVTKGYVDQIGAFLYKGHTIEAHVVKPGPTATADRRTTPIWTVTADGERFGAFPASPGDSEDEVRERLKRWVDEHLR